MDQDMKTYIDENCKESDALLAKRASDLRTGYDPEACAEINTMVQAGLLTMAQKLRAMDPSEAVKCPECRTKVYVETATSLSKAMLSIAKIPDVLIRLRPIAENQGSESVQEQADFEAMVLSFTFSKTEFDALDDQEKEEVIRAGTVLERFKTQVGG